MIIDAHNHPDWYGYNLDRFLDNMEKYSIDKTWLLTWESPEDEYDPCYLNVISPLRSCSGPIPIENCIPYVERAPEKFILGFAPDPRKPDAMKRLEASISLYGVKVFGELKLRMMYDNPDALRIYRFCGEKGLPVIVHIDYEFSKGHMFPRPNYWYGGGIEALERAVAKCPDTIFLGHAPGFWAHISCDEQFDKVPYPEGNITKGGKLLKMLDMYNNLYCDLSAGSGLNALKRDPVFAKAFLIKYQDRIVYGRDYFDNVHQEFLNQLDLPPEVLQKIYSGNAKRLVE